MIQEPPSVYITIESTLQSVWMRVTVEGIRELGAIGEHGGFNLTPKLLDWMLANLHWRTGHINNEKYSRLGLREWTIAECTAGAMACWLCRRSTTDPSADDLLDEVGAYLLLGAHEKVIGHELLAHFS